MSRSPEAVLEVSELIMKLNGGGDDYRTLVDCLLTHEKECYTKKGRLNKSRTCRILGWKSKRLEDALRGMKEHLADEFEFD